MTDITRVLTAGFPVWPGDTPFDYRLTWKIAEGSSVNVGKITTTTHLGTHIDAPFHYADQGPKLDAISLDVLIGPCRLVDASGTKLIDEAFVKGLGALPERVLFYTGQPNRWSRFPEEFAAFSAGAARLLAESGVRLVGTDAPSVDPFSSKGLPAHQALGKSGVAIIEGLALESVPPGNYQLVALPLKIEGADASPVRALLV